MAALRRAEEGLSAIEFALAAPIFLAIILPVLDLGYAFSEQIRINMAVQAGAQYAALKPWSSTSATDVANIVKGATSIPFTGDNDSVSAVQKCGCPNSSGGPTLYTLPDAPATCPSQYPSCMVDGASAGAAGYYVQIYASSAYTPAVPYSAITSNGSTTLPDGSTCPSGKVCLSSTAVVRIY